MLEDKLPQHKNMFSNVFNYKCSLCHCPKCAHIEGSTDFSFQTQFLQFFRIFSNKIHSKNQYLPHLSSENCEINSIKPETLRAFQLSNIIKSASIFQYSFEF
jgi:hypothetical protein